MRGGDVLQAAEPTYSYTLDNSDPAVDALNDGQQLSDTFSYHISDGHGGTASAMLTVHHERHHRRPSNHIQFPIAVGARHSGLSD